MTHIREKDLPFKTVRITGMAKTETDRRILDIRVNGGRLEKLIVSTYSDGTMDKSWTHLDVINQPEP